MLEASCGDEVVAYSGGPISVDYFYVCGVLRLLSPECYRLAIFVA